MGHESITTTARIYAHLYDGELDQVAAALDGLRGTR
jgi:integrase